MAFQKTVPTWGAAGVEPPESLKQSGFTANYKPPADFFNWFWYNASQCLAELQGMTPADIGAEKALYLGENPISSKSNDTYAKWLAKGTGYGYYNAAGKLNGQPTANGYLLNIAQTTGIAQVWFEIPGGKMYHRAGNSSGLATTWSEVPDAATVNTAINKAQGDATQALANNEANAERITDLEEYKQRPFSVTGDLVHLQNYEGMPMNCVTAVEPIQAGSGDPYPAGGGGKNLFTGWITGSKINPDTGEFTSTSNGVRTELIPVSGLTNIAVSGLSETLASFVAFYAADKSFKSRRGATSTASFTCSIPSDTSYIALTTYTTTETSGSISDVQDTVQIESGSNITEYEPYSNIRPISGWTGTKLTRCGENLLNYTSVAAETTTISGVTFTVNADGSITANGTATDNAILILTSSDSNPTLRNALLGNQITMSGCPSGGGTNKYVLRLFQHAGENSRVDDAGSGATTTFENADLAYNVAIIVWSGVTVSNIVFRPMIRLASGTGAGYMTYVGDTFAANFGQTIYGGTLDWETGVFTVDRALKTFKGSEYWEKSSATTSDRFISPVSGALAGSDVVCSHGNGGGSLNDLNHCYITASSNFAWNYSAYGSTTVEELKAYLAAQNTAGTPVQVVYKLATPTTIQLTPNEIHALAGANNIWSDAGETTVSGRKDILWQTNDLINRLSTVEDTVKGRNLYLGTRDFSGDWNSGDRWSISGETYRGLTVMERSEAWKGLNQTITGKTDEVYTLSAWMKADADLSVAGYAIDNSTTGFGNVTPSKQEITVGTNWQRYSYTFRVTTDGTLNPRFEAKVGGNLYICGLKLEKGDIATEYNTAPEDIWTEIDKIKAAISALAT